jgi:magnesium transporter
LTGPRGLAIPGPMELTKSPEEELDELELLTQPGREDDLRTFLLLLHPADLAELVDGVDERTAVAILRHLDPERAAEMVSELDPEDQQRVLRLVRPEELAPIVGEMETDDVTDLLQELDERTAKQVLMSLPEDERQDVAKLLDYDPYSAGGIMQTELVSVPLHTNVGAALEAVREKARDVDILSVFVVDDAGRYAGHVALQDLVLSRVSTPIEEVMEPKVAEVTPDVDQEEVAHLFDRYSLVELGVVDDDGVLLGRITADDVHEVLVEEAEEDMLKMAGTAAEPEAIYSGNVAKIVAQRMPWLASTFFAGLLATSILSAAEVVFHEAIILLMFVPVITGMSGNVGTQSAMIMIRGMATGHIDTERLAAEIFKDLQVCAVMALTCGVAVTGVVTLWKGHLALGLCVGVALAISMVTASALGSTEPALLKRFGIDPAVAAGPLITSINDVSGVMIYTAVASFFLQYIR